MLADVLLVLFPVVSSALLVGALAVPMVWRQVRPNGLYGLRTPATLPARRLAAERLTAARR